MTIIVNNTTPKKQKSKLDYSVGSPAPFYISFRLIIFFFFVVVVAVNIHGEGPWSQQISQPHQTCRMAGAASEAAEIRKLLSNGLNARNLIRVVLHSLSSWGKEAHLTFSRLASHLAISM